MSEHEPQLVKDSRERRDNFFLAQNIWGKIKSLTSKPETESAEKVGRFVFEGEMGFDVWLSHYPSVSIVSFHNTFLRESLIVRADGGFYKVNESLYDEQVNTLLELPAEETDRQDLQKFDEILTYCAANIKNKKPWNYGNTDQ